MHILKISTFLSLINLKSEVFGTFRVKNSKVLSKTTPFFDTLYSYPPKFSIKWEKLAEKCSKSEDSKKLFPFLEISNDILKERNVEVVAENRFVLNSYVKVYKNQSKTTNFFKNSTKQLQQSLQTIPVYTILNTRGDIVLANSTDSYLKSVVNIQTFLYDSAGKFYPNVERNPKLGLFFISKRDAEMYMNEIATSDIAGTNVFGLSIHCVGLDSAYRTLRSAKSDVYFKIIPDLAKLENFIATINTKARKFAYVRNMSRSNSSCQEDDKTKKSSPSLANKVNLINEVKSFTGVPIFVVKTKVTPKMLLHSKNLDHFITSKNTDACFLNDDIALLSTNGLTYIFFDKDQALSFCQQQKKNIIPYSKKSILNFNLFTRSPKVLVYSLEDLFEKIEIETLKANDLAFKSEKPLLPLENLKFVASSSTTIQDKDTVITDSTFILNKLVYYLNLKYKRLNSFFTLFLQIN